MFGVIPGGSLPGEIPEEKDLERQAAQTAIEPETCIILNDLAVAAEVDLGRGSGWQPLYPKSSLDVSGDIDVLVRLRDNAGVYGSCKATKGAQLLLSGGFGDFGSKAARYIQDEEAAAAEESLLRKKRRQDIDAQLFAKVNRMALWRQTLALFSISIFLLVILGASIFCTVSSFALEDQLQAVGLAAALLALSCGACGGASGLVYASGDSGFGAQGLRDGVQATRPELRGYQPQGIEGDDDDDCSGCWGLLCSSCVHAINFGCIVTMTVAFGLGGHGWAIGVLWGVLSLVLCCSGMFGARQTGTYLHSRAEECFCAALLLPCFWPEELAKKCGGSLGKLLLQPTKKMLDEAVHSTHERTIVFEGNVLAGRETVCSWPGKYASAWDALVAGARQNDISAAVVFLPEGSQHFGLHDPIPPKERLQGACWCIPLYGEQKPWGCRWWSKWIANIELAVEQGAILAVYYFNSRRGEGKVRDFTTAGQEHLHREAIFKCREAFKKSSKYQKALDAGLTYLSKEEGPDSSSPFSREEHRLFLIWLPEEERQFLEESEGLGNSQKAEVAWLQRKGYAYIEKEVSQLGSSSPKVIGRAIESVAATVGGGGTPYTVPAPAVEGGSSKSASSAAAQIRMLHGLHRARRKRAWRNLMTNFFIAAIVVPLLLFGLHAHSRSPGNILSFMQKNHLRLN
eukprot:s606_g10.t1